MFPSVALLMATMEETRLRRDLRHTGVLLLIIGATFLTLAILMPRLVPATPRGELFLDLQPVLFADAGIALIGGFLVTRNGDSLRLAAIVGATGYLCAAALLWGARAVEEVYSGESLAIQVPPALYRDVPMFSVRTYDQSLPFYLRRTMTLVDEKGELTFGLEFEPHKGMP